MIFGNVMRYIVTMVVKAPSSHICDDNMSLYHHSNVLLGLKCTPHSTMDAVFKEPADL